MPPCFKAQGSHGQRSGVKFGFLSTSTDKKQALGYIKFDRGMAQMFEIAMGERKDRGFARQCSSLQSSREL